MNSHEVKQKLFSLRRMERSVLPDRAWVEKTRETLLMQVKNSLPPVSERLLSRVRRVIIAFFPDSFFQVLRGPVVAGLSLFGIIIGGSVGVSAAERSVPRDFLYPVKIATEQMRLAFTSSKVDRLKLKTEFVGRRVDEIRTITSSKNVTEKPERIKEAAEILKRDLDTVKKQLNEMKVGSTPKDTAVAAKMLDAKSTDASAALKAVSVQVQPGTEARLKVTEAQVAAVSAGVNAVQVLVDHQNKPGVSEVVTNAEILQSINGKVQGVEDRITETAKQLLMAGVASSTMTIAASASSTSSASVIMFASSTEPLLGTPSSTAITQIKTAQEVLDQTKQLLVENKLNEVTDKLAESVKAVASAEALVNTVSLNTAPPFVAVTSTITTVSSTLSQTNGISSAADTEKGVASSGTGGLAPLSGTTTASSTGRTGAF